MHKVLLVFLFALAIVSASPPGKGKYKGAKKQPWDSDAPRNWYIGCQPNDPISIQQAIIDSNPGDVVNVCGRISAFLTISKPIVLRSNGNGVIENSTVVLTAGASGTIIESLTFLDASVGLNNINGASFITIRDVSFVGVEQPIQTASLHGWTIENTVFDNFEVAILSYLQVEQSNFVLRNNRFSSVCGFDFDSGGVFIGTTANFTNIEISGNTFYHSGNLPDHNPDFFGFVVLESGFSPVKRAPITAAFKNVIFSENSIVLDRYAGSEDGPSSGLDLGFALLLFGIAENVRIENNFGTYSAIVAYGRLDNFQIYGNDINAVWLANYYGPALKRSPPGKDHGKNDDGLVRVSIANNFLHAGLGVMGYFDYLRIENNQITFAEFEAFGNVLLQNNQFGPIDDHPAVQYFFHKQGEVQAKNNVLLTTGNDCSENFDDDGSEEGQAVDFGDCTPLPNTFWPNEHSKQNDVWWGEDYDVLRVEEDVQHLRGFKAVEHAHNLASGQFHQDNVDQIVAHLNDSPLETTLPHEKTEVRIAAAAGFSFHAASAAIGGVVVAVIGAIVVFVYNKKTTSKEATPLLNH